MTSAESADLETKPDSRARRHHVGEVLHGVGGNQYQRRRCGRRRTVKLIHHVEAAFAAEVDVDQCHIRPQFLEAPNRLGPARRRADHRDALALKQTASGIDENRAVIND